MSISGGTLVVRSRRRMEYRRWARNEGADATTASFLTTSFCRCSGSLSQTFIYDSLNRLTAATQSETANAQNQITLISGSATPTCDANGNMTSDQNGNTYVFDAWNWLVEVKNAAGTVIAPVRQDSADDSILRPGYGRSYHLTASVTSTSANL